MLIVERDGSIVRQQIELPAPDLQRGYTELTARPGIDLTERIEQLLDLAFDALRLSVFEVRIRDDRPR